MNTWLLGALLGSVGLVMGAGSLTGWYGAPVELSLWTALGIGWLLAARRWAPAMPARTVAWAGAVSGVTTGLIQAAFAVTLVTNNTDYATVGPAAVDAAVRAQFFAFALALGVVWGLLFAAITALVGRLARRRQAAAASSPGSVS
ncbi:MAG: hypothetical protein ACPGQL_02555 [Thermoplasmatota archaeon]